MTGPASRRVAFESARLSLARHTHSAPQEAGFVHALRVSALALGVERVSVWCFTAEGAELACQGLFTLSTQSFEASARTLPCATIPRYVAGLRERRVIAAEDARSHRLTCELAAEYFEPLGIHAVLDAPIIHAGEVVGVVCHEHVGGPRTFEQHEVDFAGSVADIVALVMEQDARIALEQELRTQEARNQRATKLEATSRLARTAAHDFNNVLTSVMSLAEQLVSTGDADVQAKASAILDAADMGARISRELLVLGRDAPSASLPVDVNEVVEGVVSLLAARFAGRIRVDSAASIAHAVVLGDPAQLERVVMNLGLNACEAMSDAGTLSIRVRAPHKNEIKARGYLAIEVRDSGPGLSPLALAHLYEPYFTTKHKGTGLGLASVHGIVKQLKGRILADNPEEGGARFVVVLPCAH